MGIGTRLDISASALTAQRLRMDVIASNIANSETTRTPDGGPYRRMRVVFSPIEPQPTSFGSLLRATPGQSDSASGSSALNTGVSVSSVVADPAPARLTYDPTHPDANEQGYVAYPNVDVSTEMADMLSATRAYEANVTVVNAEKSMALKALEIGRR
jgi:flagellar basal-body rod protein FlgC